MIRVEIDKDFLRKIVDPDLAEDARVWDAHEALADDVNAVVDVQFDHVRIGVEGIMPLRDVVRVVPGE